MFTKWTEASALLASHWTLALELHPAPHPLGPTNVPSLPRSLSLTGK